MENNYKDETKSTFINFIGEALNYVAVIVTLIITVSLSIFMDLINSTCNILRTGICSFLSKKLQKNLDFKYNYGTEKLETLAMLFCDLLLIIGTIAVFSFAVYQIVVPVKPSDDIIFGVVFKIICCVFDLIIVYINFRVYRKTKTKVAKASYAATIGNFAFDFGILTSVLLALVFRNWGGVVYVEPISSILIAIVIIWNAVFRIKDYSKELIDVTLDEKDQIVITKILTKHFSEYNQFYSVNSRMLGDIVCVDFRLSFKDDSTYKDIINSLKAFKDELKEAYEKCKVSLIFDERHLEVEEI